MERADQSDTYAFRLNMDTNCEWFRLKTSEILVELATNVAEAGVPMGGT